MQIHPYLNFAGDCRDAMTFYHSILGGELEMMAHKDVPSAEHVPAEMQNQIMHASIKLGDALIMASDAPMAQSNGFSGVYVSLHLDTIEDADRIFTGLQQGGTIQMNLEKTFWAERFGMLIDKFGVKWMFNVE